MYFSCFAKKSTKRRRPRGAELLAPASKAALLKNLSDTHLRWRWSTLTYILFVQKMFRFFVRKVSLEKNRQSGPKWNSPLSVRLQSANKLCPLRYSAVAKCVPGVVHRRGRLGSRERDTQRLSYADFFGYFLVRRQESNITAPSNLGHCGSSEYHSEQISKIHPHYPFRCHQGNFP